MRIVIELTNRCNLRCQHCFSGRHGGKDDLPLEVLQTILDEARPLGFDDLTYTGGDPTVHPRFFEILQRTVDAGYSFGFVTNGWNFTSIFPQLRGLREGLRFLTFSMDGASETTHDRMRGRGSYRRLVQAMSVCVVEQLPFTINMVLTAHNRHELEQAIQRAARLGSQGIRFGHLMPSPLTTAQGFDLSPDERREVEAEIRRLAVDSPIPAVIAPGHHTTELFPCAPLQGQEVNVDCHGNLTKCCHLSGHGDGVGVDDIYGNLRDTGLAAALGRLVRDNERLLDEKRRRHDDGAMRETDYYPCWYCSLHYRKVDWLKRIEGHPWGDLVQ